MTFRNLTFGLLLCGLSLVGCANGDSIDNPDGGAGSNNGGAGGTAGNASTAGNAGDAGSSNNGGNGGSDNGGSDNGGNGGSDNGGNGGNGGNGQSGAGGSDVGDGGLDSGIDAGFDAAVDAAVDTGPVEFTVPFGGGEVTLTLAGGIAVTFDFPASAAGADIILAPSTDEAIGWPEGTFAGVIQMSPDGFSFTDPVRVSLADGSLILLNFPSSATQSAPDPLALASDGQALELTHFSSLAIVAPGQSCQSQSGWTDLPNSQQCANAGGGKTSYRSYGCKNFAFCYVIVSGCCVVPGTPNDGCHVGDTNLTLLYTRTDSNGGQYPYCDLLSVDAGLDGGQVGVAPYLQSYVPQQLIAAGGDQVITLYGTNFAQGGTVFINLDMAITTTWVSAGEAFATVSGQYLFNPGSLNGVGYVNPAQLGGFDWLNRSNMVNIPIVAASSDGGTSTPDASVTVDAGSSPDASTGAPDASSPVDASTGAPDASSPGADGSTGAPDASTGAPDASVLPVLDSIVPSTVPKNQGDQVVTLYGSGFDPNGTAFYWMDFAASTIWIDSTEVQMILPENTLLQIADVLNDVGYVNPAPGGGFDWQNRSNVLDISVVEVVPDAGDSGL